MTREDAEQLSIALLQIVGRLDQTGAFVRDKDSTENWEAYRQALGEAMGAVAFGLAERLWKRYPDLKPIQLGGTYEVDPAIHEPRFYACE